MKFVVIILCVVPCVVWYWLVSCTTVVWENYWTLEICWFVCMYVCVCVYLCMIDCFWMDLVTVLSQLIQIMLAY